MSSDMSDRFFPFVCTSLEKNLFQTVSNSIECNAVRKNTCIVTCNFRLFVWNFFNFFEKQFQIYLNEKLNRIRSFFFFSNLLTSISDLHWIIGTVCWLENKVLRHKLIIFPAFFLCAKFTMRKNQWLVLFQFWCTADSGNDTSRWRLSTVYMCR